jgi:hypothetical protein
MSTEAIPAPVERPRTVDYALYAIVAKCVFSVLFAFALYTARSEVTDQWRKDHPDWSATTLHDKFESAIRANIIQAIVITVLVLLIAKFIRDGKNWARWLFAVLMVVPFTPLADVLRLLSVFMRGGLLLKVLSLIIGLSTLAAVVLLFVRPSSPYFRKTAVDSVVRVSPFAALFRPRPRPGAAKGGAPATPPVSEPAGKRNSPRSKSRKASTE